MYYATYKNAGNSDIAAFNTKQQRDDWVNFRDPFSKTFGANSENCTFKRMAISNEEAEQKIKHMQHTKDNINNGQEWYINEY